MADKENIYECEVKRQFVIDGQKKAKWLKRNVADAIRDEVTEFRCKDCHGAVKLFRKHVEHGAAPHAEQKFRADSEYCPAGMYFRQNPGRTPRLSENPVE